MASPWQGLAAHDRQSVRAGEGKQPCEAALVFAGEGVVRVVLEAHVLPACVDAGVDVLPTAAPPEFGKVDVADTGVVEPARHLRTSELGVASRAGLGAHVDEQV